MLLRLILLFTLIPLIELALLIELGRLIGLWNTLALVIITGVVGASLARTQGFGVLQRIQYELSQGQLPGESLLDGVLILAGALLLLTPGLLTDIVGFGCLFPFTRALLKAYLKRFFKNKIQSGEFHVRYRVEDKHDGGE